MKTRSRFAASVFAVLLAGPWTPARADQPIFEDLFYEEGSAEVADCGTFQIIDNYVINVREQRMLDRFGNAIKLIEHVWGVDTLTNSVTGESFSGLFHNNVSVDFALRRGTSTGIFFRITIPGMGAVVLDIGRLTEDRQGNVYFDKGPRTLIGGDLAQLCALFESGN